MGSHNSCRKDSGNRSQFIYSIFVIFSISFRNTRMENQNEELTLPVLIENINQHFERYKTNPTEVDKEALLYYACILGERLGLPTPAAELYARIFYKSIFGFFPEKHEVVDILSNYSMEEVYGYFRVLEKSHLVQFVKSPKSPHCTYWISWRDEQSVMANRLPRGNEMNIKLLDRKIKLTIWENDKDYWVMYDGQIVGSVIKDLLSNGDYEVFVSGKHIMTSDCIIHIEAALNNKYNDNELELPSHL